MALLPPCLVGDGGRIVGRVSLGAIASNSDTIRSAQSTAHDAKTRRSSSLKVKAPGRRSLPMESPVGCPG